ncbi:MAG: hypothetical protein JXB50_01795 [Spirochaetes bacterium]|nr:hypothetical protein [Spirochaetota bacterium]
MKRLYLIFFIIILLSCGQIKITKNFTIDFNKILKVKKKINRKIRIGIDKNYLKTSDGRITRQIIKDFLKYRNIKDYSIKKLNKDKMVKDYGMRKLEIIISHPDKQPYKNQLSLPFLSYGIYFLTQTDSRKKININKLTANIKSGFLNNSYASRYMESRYGKRYNHLKYIHFENLLDDFKKYKMDLMIISRENYYDNIFSIPSKTLSFINFNSYSSVIISDNNFREQFNNYLKKYNRNFDWQDKIFIKKSFIGYFEKFIRNMDNFTVRTIKEFKEMK